MIVQDVAERTLTYLFYLTLLQFAQRHSRPLHVRKLVFHCEYILSDRICSFTSFSALIKHDKAPAVDFIPASNEKMPPVASDLDIFMYSFLVFIPAHRVIYGASRGSQSTHNERQQNRSHHFPRSQPTDNTQKESQKEQQKNSPVTNPSSNPSILFTSSPSISNPPTFAFSTILSFLTLFGNTTCPFCKFQRSINCAGVHLYFSLSSTMVGWSIFQARARGA